MKISALESLFKKVASLNACNFIKKSLQHRYFPVNIAKFLRKSFFIEHLWWLLLTKCLYLQQIFTKPTPK